MLRSRPRAAGGWSLACWTGAGRWPPPPNGFRLMPRRSVSGATDSSLRVMPGCGTGRAGPVVHRTARLRRSAGRVLQLRRKRRWGAAHIGFEVGLAASTVQAILNASGVGRLDQGDRATHTPKLPAQRYQRERPGELIHVDVKKLGGIPSGGGWRTRGRGYPGEGAKARMVGYRYLHSAIDDRTRIVYSEILDNERASTAAGFWARAAAWYQSIGIPVERQRALLPLGTVAPGMRRDRDHREQDPALPAPNKRQDRAIPPDPLRGMGLHSALDPQKPNGPAPTPGSCISTITTDPTEHSAGQPQPASSRTTSPRCTPRDRVDGVHAAVGAAAKSGGHTGLRSLREAMR